MFSGRKKDQNFVNSCNVQRCSEETFTSYITLFIRYLDVQWNTTWAGYVDLTMLTALSPHHRKAIVPRLRAIG